MQWDNIAIMIFFVYIFLQRVGSLLNTANSSAWTSGKIMISLPSRSFSGRSHAVAGSIAWLRPERLPKETKSWYKHRIGQTAEINYPKVQECDVFSH